MWLFDENEMSYGTENCTQGARRDGKFLGFKSFGGEGNQKVARAFAMIFWK